FHAPGGTLEVDRGHRPGPHRTRGGRAAAQGDLDRCQPPDHLPRPPCLPRPDRGVRRVRPGPGLPFRRRGRPARSGRRRPSRGGARKRSSAGTGRTGGAGMSASTRWTLVAFVVLVGVVVALATTLGSEQGGGTAQGEDPASALAPGAAPP